MKFEVLDEVEESNESIDIKEYLQSNGRIQLHKYLHSKLLRNKNPILPSRRKWMGRNGQYYYSYFYHQTEYWRNLIIKLRSKQGICSKIFLNISINIEMRKE